MSDWYKTDIRTPQKKNEVKKNRLFLMSGPYKTALRRWFRIGQSVTSISYRYLDSRIFGPI